MNVEELIQAEVNKLNTAAVPAKSNGGPPIDNNAENMKVIGGQSSEAFREAARVNAERALQAVRALAARVEEIQQSVEKFALEMRQRGDELATTRRKPSSLTVRMRPVLISSNIFVLPTRNKPAASGTESSNGSPAVQAGLPAASRPAMDLGFFFLASVMIIARPIRYASAPIALG